MVEGRVKVYTIEDFRMVEGVSQSLHYIQRISEWLHEESKFTLQRISGWLRESERRVKVYTRVVSE